MKANKVVTVADTEIRINVSIVENQAILLETAQLLIINLETDQDLEVVQMIDVEENIDEFYLHYSILDFRILFDMHFFVLCVFLQNFLFA